MYLGVTLELIWSCLGQAVKCYRKFDILSLVQDGDLEVDLTRVERKDFMGVLYVGRRSLA